MSCLGETEEGRSIDEGVVERLSGLVGGVALGPTTRLAGRAELSAECKGGRGSIVASVLAILHFKTAYTEKAGAARAAVSLTPKQLDYRKDLEVTEVLHSSSEIAT